MASTTLSSIRTKVRRLTRSPSVQQISNADIDEYINTFVLYDMPSHLRLFNLKKTFSFYTEPNVDTYSTNTIDVNNPMYNFKNAIITSSDPVYVAGYKSWFSQDRLSFFARWPMVKQLNQIGTGDGATTNFTGTLSNIPVTPSDVMFTSIDTNGNAVGLVAVPVIDATTGVQTQNGNLYSTLGAIPTTPPTAVLANNTINFKTGVYDITFSSAPAASEEVNVQAVPYSAGRPTSVLYFNNTFTVRPIPDRQYDVKIEVYVMPTELLTDVQSPDLEQWSQYIAYGASIKVLQDRVDMDTVALLMPEFKQQEKLVLRTTLVQQGDDRAATIYSDQSGLSGGPNGWWNNTI